MLSQSKIRRFSKETAKITWKSRVIRVVSLLALFLVAVSTTSTFGQTVSAFLTQTPPKTWIDADTGHRVTRLTDEPGSETLLSSRGVYTSSRNAFTPDGLDMIYVSPQGIHVLNLATLKTKLIVSGPVFDVIVGTKTRRVFFNTGNALRVCDIDTGKVTLLHAANEILMPLSFNFHSVNADETLLVGTARESGAKFDTSYFREARELIEAKTGHGPDQDAVVELAKKMRLDSHTVEYMFTTNLQTGESRIILKGTDWLDHVQFSPTDPDLILYKHEAPYANTEVDRIWTIRADGSQKKMIHQRATPEEIVTRQFWSRDGKTIWYELHKPIPNKQAATDYYLVGYDVATGKRRYFHLDQLEYSVNYDAANDGNLFCGSGHPTRTAHGKAPTDDPITRSGEWIEILHPIVNKGDAGTTTQDAISFRRERLVNMFYNNYNRFEPEVRFSPDNRLVIFTSNVYDTPNLYAHTYVLAVEVN